MDATFLVWYGMDSIRHKIFTTAGLSGFPGFIIVTAVRVITTYPQVISVPVNAALFLHFHRSMECRYPIHTYSRLSTSVHMTHAEPGNNVRI